MEKRTIANIKLVTCLFALSYVVTLWLTYEPNPLNWELGVRMTIALILAIVLIVNITIAYSKESDYRGLYREEVEKSSQLRRQVGRLRYQIQLANMTPNDGDDADNIPKEIKKSKWKPKFFVGIGCATVAALLAGIVGKLLGDITFAQAMVGIVGVTLCSLISMIIFKTMTEVD